MASPAKRLKPGDVLVSTLEGPTSWKSALVIHVDMGEIGSMFKRGRAASALLLVSGGTGTPCILERDFVWIAGNFIKV